jgi:3-hydroxyacyl-[acyl-carrier-protein] dehydratase
MNDTTGESAPTTLEAVDIVGILELLPHRYPFLLVDRIRDIDGVRSCISGKNVSFNEPQFTGLFLIPPIFPAVLICQG